MEAEVVLSSESDRKCISIEQCKNSVNIQLFVFKSIDEVAKNVSCKRIMKGTQIKVLLNKIHKKGHKSIVCSSTNIILIENVRQNWKGLKITHEITNVIKLIYNALTLFK